MIEIESKELNDCASQVIELLRTEYFKISVQPWTQGSMKNMGLGLDHAPMLPTRSEHPSGLQIGRPPSITTVAQSNASPLAECLPSSGRHRGAHRMRTFQPRWRCCC